MVVGNQERIGGFERFKAGEYDGNGGLSKKMMIFSKIRDKSDSFVLALILSIGSSIGDGEWFVNRS